MRKLLLKGVELIPQGARTWVSSRPAIAVPIAKLLRMIVPSGKPIIVTIQKGPNEGLKLAIDRATPRYYWLSGHDEPDVLSVLQQQAKPGMVVIDVGAHVGIETMMFSRWVGSAGKVISVEADADTYRRLQTNCQINSLTNVELVEAAVSDHRGVVQFDASSEVTSGIISGNASASGSVRDVKCLPLDDLSFGAAQGKVDLVKIDVEGHEFAVLRGAERTLRELRPALLIEIHNRAALHDCVRQLKQFGYAIRSVPSIAEYDRLIESDAPIAAPTSEDGFKRSHLLATSRTR